MQKQAKALESLNFSNKINQLKQVKDVFPDKQLNNLTEDSLKKVIELQKSIKINNSKLFINKKEL